MFGAEMLLMTKGGATYWQADYRTWLREAGFGSITVEATAGPTTLIYAR